jgi:hypothetical protein
MRFHVGRVVSVTGGTGAWALVLDVPMVDETGAIVAVDDVISPPAVNLEAYADTFLTLMSGLGAGEISATELPRRGRHPMVTDGVDSEIAEGFLASFTHAHSEISRAAIGVASPSIPTVPASVDSPPNILTPGAFGIYPI